MFFAANDDAISGLITAGAYSEADGDVIVICSKKVTAMQQRNPGGSFRDGTLSPTYVSLGPLLADATDLDDLRDAFRKRVSI
jgi:hypothetical protein